MQNSLEEANVSLFESCSFLPMLSPQTCCQTGRDANSAPTVASGDQKATQQRDMMYLELGVRLSFSWTFASLIALSTYTYNRENWNNILHIVSDDILGIVGNHYEPYFQLYLLRFRDISCWDFCHFNTEGDEWRFVCCAQSVEFLYLIN